MPLEDMAAVMPDTAVPVAGTLAHTPRRPMFEVDIKVLLFAAGVVTSLLAHTMRATRAATRGAQVAHIMRGTRAATRGAHITGLAAVIREVVPGIRTLDIPDSAIMAWAMAIHTTVLAITVTAPVGATIRITDIIHADIILTDTDTGPI